MEAYYYKDDKGEDIEITTIPDDLKDLANEWHDNLIEKICELDDDLMMQYLEGEEPSVDDLKKVLRKLQSLVKQFLYIVDRLQEQRCSEDVRWCNRIYASSNRHP